MLYLLQGLFINNWGVLRIFKSIMLRASVALEQFYLQLPSLEILQINLLYFYL